MTAVARNVDRERRIVALRDQGLSMRAIGREVGISGERVRQILARIGRVGRIYHPCLYCGNPVHLVAKYCDHRCALRYRRREAGLPTPEDLRNERDVRNAEMARLRRDGKTAREIAAMMGLHPARVGVILGQIAPLGEDRYRHLPTIPHPRRNESRNESRNQAMQQDRDSGLLPRQIAEKYGVTIRVVYNETRRPCPSTRPTTGETITVRRDQIRPERGTGVTVRETLARRGTG